MGLKVRLEWFDRTTEWLIGEEDSPDQGDDYSIVMKLGLSVDQDVNNGMFELHREWLPLVQPYFAHQIALSESDYFIALDLDGAR